MRTWISLLLLLAGCSTAQGGTVDGKALYTANCLICHGAKGDGKGSAGVALKPKPRDFTSPTWWEAQTDQTVAATIRAGKTGTSMKPFAKLTDTDVAALTAYLRGFKAATP